MEKSKIELIKEFIETCPLLKNGKVNVDYIKDKPQSYSIDETPATTILTQFADGGTRNQILFDFSIQANFSVLENIKNSKFCDDFTKWIYEQDKKNNLPKIERHLLDTLYRERNNTPNYRNNSNIRYPNAGSI